MDKQIYNKENALAIVDNDPELLNELQQIFFDEKESMLTMISAAIETQDSALLQLSAHGMKGSLSNLGAENAAAVAFVLEQFGANNFFEEVPAKFEQLLREVRLFEETIKAEQA